jgi:E3 ubiquitin-protein ligase BRE1
MESNVRLLKQINEKDEMNAKSLSTILHLKSLTEKLSAEKDTLEQQAKSASQLALAARLATNAKERVSEEIVKEKTALEGRVAELEKQYETTKAELDRVSTECSESSGKMAMKDSELVNALKRSDELVTENEQKREEIRKLVDVVNKAEREASEAKERLANAVKSGAAADAMDASSEGGAASAFTVDQLKTQVSVLKSRLACPVCHYRDKECIILRCRHMHCKQCVDERISNRSRKCPTCNVKFSENDVGDVWLN